MIRVLIVSQLSLLCNLLEEAFDKQADMHVAGCVTSPHEAYTLAADCDVLLVDRRLPGRSAVDLIRSVAVTYPQVKPLAFGLVESKAQILQFIQAGAAGYVLKRHSVEELMERIRSVQDGHAKVSPRIASALIAMIGEYARLFGQANRPRPGVDTLTAREREILPLIKEGFTNLEIAERLVIEVGTVKNHVHNILKKLDTNSRHEAAMVWMFAESQPANLEVSQEGLFAHLAADEGTRVPA